MKSSQIQSKRKENFSVSIFDHLPTLTMEWIRGEEIGRGSFASIYLAIPTSETPVFQASPLMAVKSSLASCSATLKNENEVLDLIGTCPQIIRCYGDSLTTEKGEEYYNLLLEYANGGSIADRMKINGGSLLEPEIKQYTRSILEGLRYIHEKGFVHCDIKIQNVLVFQNGQAKIADFGLARKTEEGKKTGEERKTFEWRGTPMYMSPECVNGNEYGPACDVWALGCAVVEMVTGRSVWNVGPGENICYILIRIGAGEEVPEIPNELSEEGRDFVRKCFVKNPAQRWTAEMLLRHPFVSDNHRSVSLTPLLVKEEEAEKSPRGPFDFPESVSQSDTSLETTSRFGSPGLSTESDRRRIEREQNFSYRLRQLATVEEVPNWSVSNSWITVR